MANVLDTPTTILASAARTAGREQNKANMWGAAINLLGQGAGAAMGGR